MAVAGDLVVNLSANTRNFTNGMDKASKRLDAFAGRGKAMATSMGSNLTGMAVGFVSVGAAIGVATKSMAAFHEASRATERFQAITKATGNVARLSSEQYDSMAASLMRVTDFDDDAATQAMGTLSKFGSLSGDIFKRTIPLAADLAEVMGTDLDAAANTLGKALDSPAEGVGTLERAIGKLTETQKKQIESLVDMGRKTEAQGMILDIVAGKVGGTAEAMSSPLIRLSNVMGNLSEAVGGLLTRFAEGFTAESGIEGWAERQTEALKNMETQANSLGRALSKIANWTPVTDFAEMMGFKTVEGGRRRMDEGKAAQELRKQQDMMMPGGAGPIAVPDFATSPLNDMPIGMGLGNGIEDAMRSIFGTVDKFAGLAPPPGSRPGFDFGLDEMYREGSSIEEVKKDRETSGTRFAGAMEKGSAEAYSTILQAMGQSDDRKQLDDLNKTAKEQLKEIKKKGVFGTPKLNVVEGWT